MTQPSRGACFFRPHFWLPYLGGGLAFIYSQLLSRGNFNTFDIFTGIMFGSVFVFIGGGLIYAAFRGYGLLKQQAAREESNPLSPWLWRLDWASRRAESQNKKSEIASWVFAILCNLITLPFLFRMVPNFARNGDPRVFLLLGCNLFGVILIVKALRATIRHRRFGGACFEFHALPFSPGERVGGRIHLKLDTRAEHGIDLRLSCVRKLVSGSGDNRGTNQIVLWQAEHNVPAGAVEPGPLGRAIPVDFSPPADNLVTDHDNPSDQVLWLLHAQADVPGVDYSDDFDIPVFRSDVSGERFRTTNHTWSGQFRFRHAACQRRGFRRGPAARAYESGRFDGLRRQRILFSGFSQPQPCADAIPSLVGVDRRRVLAVPETRTNVLFYSFWVERFICHRRLSARRVGKRAHHRPQRRNSFTLRRAGAGPHAPNSSFRGGRDCTRRKNATGQQLRQPAPCDSNAVE